MRSCPEKTKIHTYIYSQKARQLGAKRNKRQLSTLAKGCGKSAGPRAGRADGGPFAGGVRTRRPAHPAPAAPPTSPLQPRRKPARAEVFLAFTGGEAEATGVEITLLGSNGGGSEPWSLRALPFPRRRCSQTERIPRKCPPPAVVPPVQAPRKQY